MSTFDIVPSRDVPDIVLHNTSDTFPSSVNFTIYKKLQQALQDTAIPRFNKIVIIIKLTSG